MTELITITNKEAFKLTPDVENLKTDRFYCSLWIGCLTTSQKLCGRIDVCVMILKGQIAGRKLLNNMAAMSPSNLADLLSCARYDKHNTAMLSKCCFSYMAETGL